MSMIDLGEGLAERLKTIKGLRVYSLKNLPDTINQFPSAIILPAETEYVTTLNSNDADYNFRIIFLIAKQDTPSAIMKLLPYLETSGDKSVVAAVHADRKLSVSGEDMADDCKVSLNRGISNIVWGGVPYLSTEFAVQIWAE